MSATQSRYTPAVQQAQRPPLSPRLEALRELYAAAAVLSVPLFLFQEGNEWAVPPNYAARYALGAPPLSVEAVFREIARRTGGAYSKFDSGAAKQLNELLRAAAVFAVGGLKALTDLRSDGARKLLGQMGRR